MVQQRQTRVAVLQVGVRCSIPAMMLRHVFSRCHSVALVSATARPWEWLVPYLGLSELRQEGYMVQPSEPELDRRRVLLCRPWFDTILSSEPLRFSQQQLLLSNAERSRPHSREAMLSSSASIAARIGVLLMDLILDTSAARPAGSIMLCLWQSNDKMRRARLVLEHVAQQPGVMRASDAEQQAIKHEYERTPHGEVRLVQDVLAEALAWRLAAQGFKVVLHSVYGSRFAEGLDLKELCCVLLVGSPAPNCVSVAYKAMQQRLMQQQLQGANGVALRFSQWERQNNLFSVTQAAGRAVRGPAGADAYHAGCLVLLGEGFHDLRADLPDWVTTAWDEVAVDAIGGALQVWLEARQKEGMVHLVPPLALPPAAVDEDDA